MCRKINCHQILNAKYTVQKMFFSSVCGSLSLMKRCVEMSACFHRSTATIFMFTCCWSGRTRHLHLQCWCRSDYFQQSRLTTRTGCKHTKNFDERKIFCPISLSFSIVGLCCKYRSSCRALHQGQHSKAALVSCSCWWSPQAQLLLFQMGCHHSVWFHLVSPFSAKVNILSCLIFGQSSTYPKTTRSARSHLLNKE